MVMYSYTMRGPPAGWWNARKSRKYEKRKWFQHLVEANQRKKKTGMTILLGINRRANRSFAEIAKELHSIITLQCTKTHPFCMYIFIWWKVNGERGLADLPWAVATNSLRSTPSIKSSLVSVFNEIKSTYQHTCGNQCPPPWSSTTSCYPITEPNEYQKCHSDCTSIVHRPFFR